MQSAYNVCTNTFLTLIHWTAIFIVFLAPQHYNDGVMSWFLLTMCHIFFLFIYFIIISDRVFFFFSLLVHSVYFFRPSFRYSLTFSLLCAGHFSYQNGCWCFCFYSFLIFMTYLWQSLLTISLTLSLCSRSHNNMFGISVDCVFVVGCFKSLEQGIESVNNDS